MKYIESTDEGINLQRYLDYLDSCAASLPPGARSYATADGRYQMHHRGCLHDSWIEKIAIIETGTSPDGRRRLLQIEIVLLDAYHEGYHFLTYSGVRRYSGDIMKSWRVQTPIGHGDWMVDEVRAEPDGLVTHEILFAETGSWTITCDDLHYQWTAKPTKIDA